MTDTICALSTAPGGAIAVVRVSGPEAIAVTSAIFSKDITRAKGYTLHFGRIAGGVDEAVVSVFRAPRSYTGEDTAEISCHGSPYVVRRTLEALIDHGARQARPGEFTQRAFLNGKMDLSQAEAVADLIASTNKATHQMAMSQLRGGFSDELRGLRAQLLELTSLLELELDFSEQDVEFADRKRLLSLSQKIESHIGRLSASFKTGNALKNGVPVAIIGAPNVGKSTLLNTLLHEERAIVSSVTGTTRDTIEDVMQIGGVTFRFIDTAGIRKTRDQIEKIGIEKSLRAAERAQIIILLTEDKVPFPDIKFDEGKTVLRVINKCDYTLPSSSFLYHRVPQGNLFHISAVTGDGIALLQSALVKAAAIPEIMEGDTIVTNARHHEALSHSTASIRRVIEGIRSGIPGDLIAQDLRECAQHLAEITGEAVSSTDVLKSIFSRFCVGK